MITDKQIAEWERLAGAATAGPWIPWVVRDADDPEGHWLATSSKHVPTSEDAKVDAAFIAASREAVPALVAALREARASDPVRAALAAVADILTAAQTATEVRTADGEGAMRWFDTTDDQRAALRVLADAAKEASDA